MSKLEPAYVIKNGERFFMGDYPIGIGLGEREKAFVFLTRNCAERAILSNPFVLQDAEIIEIDF